jgi:hypothetical protein
VPISLDGTRTTWLGNPIVMLRAPLAQAGWSITLMRPVGRAILFAWIAAIITAALVLGMAIIGWMWMERGRESGRPNRGTGTSRGRPHRRSAP